jgi:predicted RNase H-like nuclease (RuvC/YqgF family)
MVNLILINGFGFLAIYFFMKYKETKSSLDSCNESLKKANEKVEFLERNERHLKKIIESQERRIEVLVKNTKIDDDGFVIL